MSFIQIETYRMYSCVSNFFQLHCLWDSFVLLQGSVICFHCCMEFCCRNTPQFIHSPGDRHVCYFQFGLLWNAAMEFMVIAFWYTLIHTSVWYVPENGTQGHKLHIYLHFSWFCQTVSHSDWSSVPLDQQCMSVQGILHPNTWHGVTS